MSEDWSWSCSKCDKLGPYTDSDFKYPKGWRFNLTHGLVCSKCAKRYNIKTSDVEFEAPTILVEEKTPEEKAHNVVLKPSWERL